MDVVDCLAVVVCGDEVDDCDADVSPVLTVAIVSLLVESGI